MESIDHCPLGIAYIEPLALKQGKNMPFQAAVAALQQVETLPAVTYLLHSDLRVSPTSISGL